mgnify:CR=1 FL=1|tara:strand:+ start:697 stop:972 length:276 start_codon:yes stop_codon:yes gene_type:complete
MGNSEYTKCYLSETGHKDFMYPSTSTALLSPGFKFTVLAWIGGSAEGLKPVKVLKSYLTSYQIDESIKNNISDSSEYKHTVVWISDKYIAP